MLEEELDRKGMSEEMSFQSVAEKNTTSYIGRLASFFFSRSFSSQPFFFFFSFLLSFFLKFQKRNCMQSILL
jgi:hypothetical protein